jgi:D-alanyl-D-alanine carboxypeptidase/D-alanyl-D-alanine-endopeptidase (penicillin-binding protein 4)
MLISGRISNLKNKWAFVASAMLWTFLFAFITGDIARAQSTPTLTERIQRVTSRPEFAHANFGIEFYSLDSGKVVYALNPEKMFVPASTTKLLTEGALLAKLGADYRFHTRIYRTGPVDSKGKLKGDLILVASGDPNLSNRMQPDGTLAFVDEDHSYNGPALPGEPLFVIKELAGKISAKGIKRIEGRLLIDTSLLPDGGREGGTDVVMSSIMVNDNVIDLVVRPGAKSGDATILEYSPHTSYANFINHITTAAQDSKPNLESPEVESNEDGSILATLNGSLPTGSTPQTVAFAVPSPTAFATAVLREALVGSGVQFKKGAKNRPPDFADLSRFYLPENLVAEHVSAPLSEEIRVTLKVSQNLHAGMGPYLLGTLVAKDMKNPLAAGFRIEREFLQSANLDLSGASQGDGAGGDWADLFSPDFMIHYLTYWTTHPDYLILLNALPVLGKDGTLAAIQKDSPGAGHVFAKTGTFVSEDKLNGKAMLNAKGLAGYVTTKSGERLVFAAYVNHVALPDDPDAGQRIAGQALGEIAAAAYDADLR